MVYVSQMTSYLVLLIDKWKAAVLQVQFFECSKTLHSFTQLVRWVRKFHIYGRPESGICPLCYKVDLQQVLADISGIA